MRFLSLFTGIGGMDLGLERSGMTCVGQCEIDPYAVRVLQKRWPAVWRHSDVRTLTKRIVHENCGHIDIIAGGFPCQGISFANPLGLGLADARSGLWSHFIRLIRGVRPEIAIVENVPALLVRGAGTVLGELAASGYDAEWDCLPAAAFGAPHLRFRIAIIAYPNRKRRKKLDTAAVSNRPFFSGGVFAFDTDRDTARTTKESCIGGAPCQRQLPFISRRFGELRGTWGNEPDVGRVDYGIPNRVERLRGIGNAVVPDLAEWIGRRIFQLTTSN